MSLRCVRECHFGVITKLTSYLAEVPASTTWIDLKFNLINVKTVTVTLEQDSSTMLFFKVQLHSSPLTWIIFRLLYFDCSSSSPNTKVLFCWFISFLHPKNPLPHLAPPMQTPILCEPTNKQPLPGGLS